MGEDMQTEVDFESPDLLLTKNSDAAQGIIVVMLGGIVKVAIVFTIGLLISMLATGISIMATGWLLGDLGLG